MRLPGILRNNLRLKALAAGLALVTWAAVVYAANPPESRTVTVHVPQAPQSLPGQYVLAHPVADLSVRILGTREHVDAFDTSSLSVSVDWHAIRGSGRQDLPVTIVNNDRDVDLDSPPTTVSADVDLLASSTVPVQIVIKSPPPAGYVIQQEALTPDHVTLIGPKRELDGAQAVVSVDLSNRKTFLSQEFNVLVHDAAGRSIPDIGVREGTVRVDITIRSETASRSSAVKPAINGSPAAGHYLAAFSTDPLTVVISGPQDLLNGLDVLSTQPVSMNGLSTGTYVFTVKVLPPAGVTATPDTVTVHVTIAAIPVPTPSATPTPTPTAPPTPTPT